MNNEPHAFLYLLSRFMTFTSSVILGKLSLEKTPILDVCVASKQHNFRANESVLSKLVNCHDRID